MIEKSQDLAWIFPFNQSSYTKDMIKSRT